MITILSVSVIVLGFLLVVATIKERHDKKDEGEYNKTNFSINLIKGFYSIIIGSLEILNIISERNFINLMILLAGINIFIDYKIKNQPNR
ncbi:MULTISPECIES: hypothetical protein [Romboutsia]|uniref:hypothetical protein n=1 Tax=Romboutsia TaxID=1501226 RepID=UPI001898904E|nr:MULTISPECIES: hypothetical protein [Romboutsia]MCH1959837.1 hypothetical protein [Romboutsia hominis]MCH1969740.1 hypothetical protein [Romboutsia hominis]